jgi:hypothetical protein
MTISNKICGGLVALALISSVPAWAAKKLTDKQQKAAEAAAAAAAAAKAKAAEIAKVKAEEKAKAEAAAKAEATWKAVAEHPKFQDILKQLEISVENQKVQSQTFEENQKVQSQIFEENQKAQSEMFGQMKKEIYGFSESLSKVQQNVSPVGAFLDGYKPESGEEISAKFLDFNERDNYVMLENDTPKEEERDLLEAGTSKEESRKWFNAGRALASCGETDKKLQNEIKIMKLELIEMRRLLKKALFLGDDGAVDDGADDTGSDDSGATMMSGDVPKSEDDLKAQKTKAIMQYE